MTHKALLPAAILFFLSCITAQTKPDRVVLPFRTVAKSIVIRGSVNGREGNLLLDTGIPKMLLNQKCLTNGPLFSTKDHGDFQSVNGATQNALLSLVILELGDFSVKTDVNVANLSALERQKGIDILGVIGVDVFTKYELEIDFFTEELRLFRLDRNGNRRWQEPQPLPSETLSFEYRRHLPCIPVTWQGQTLRLGLDTGAGRSMLTAAIYERARNQFPTVRSVAMQDLNGTRTTALSAWMRGLQLDDLEIPPLPALFVPTDLHNDGMDGRNMHGLLGFGFFRHYRTAINFKKRKVYLWDARTVQNLPVANGDH